MVTATLNSTALAESTETQFVEGNYYFPPSSIKKELFKPSETHTFCPWKGEASYYNVELEDGTVVKDAAWYYPATVTERAEPLKNFVAFYKSKIDVKE